MDPRNFQRANCIAVFALCGILELLRGAPCPGQTNVDPASKKNAVLASLQVPVGTILPVRINQSFSSKNAKTGRIITGRIMQEVPLHDSAKIPKGTTVAGKITSVEPAGQDHGGKISLVFDELLIQDRRIPITTNLRAIASFVEVQFAQVPGTGPEYGTPSFWATTRQIGGDEVYGKEGVVTDQWSRTIGKSTYDGVLVHVRAQPGMKCRGPLGSEDQLQALWVFSSDACGVYGMTSVQIVHAGRTEPEGVIILAWDCRDMKVPRATGMLLRVLR